MPRRSTARARRRRVGAQLFSEKASLRGFPDVVADDCEFRVLARDPLRARPLLSHASAGVGMLHPVGAIPDLTAGVDGIREDADPAPRVAVDSRHAPGRATRRGHAIAVESCRDLARARAGKVFREDAPNDLGLRWIDLARASLLRAVGADAHAIPVRQAASARATQRAAGQPTMRLVGEILEVQLRHQRAQPDVGFVRLPRRVDAIGYADETDASERETFHGRGALSAVAAETREIVDEQHVEAMRVGKHRAISGSIAARAAHRRIGIRDWIRPTVPRGERAAVPQLIVEARLALLVGTVTGVGGDAHRRGDYAASSSGGNGT